MSALRPSSFALPPPPCSTTSSPLHPLHLSPRHLTPSHHHHPCTSGPFSTVSQHKPHISRPHIHSQLPQLVPALRPHRPKFPFLLRPSRYSHPHSRLRFLYIHITRANRDIRKPYSGSQLSHHFGQPLHFFRSEEISPKLVSNFPSTLSLPST